MRDDEAKAWLHHRLAFNSSLTQKKALQCCITTHQRESKSAQGGSGKGKESNFKCSSLVGFEIISKDKMLDGICLQAVSYEHQGAPIELMFSFVLEGPRIETLGSGAF